ncbi:MAG: 5-dehydro-4-deoxy-D-glucuronate isomerase [Verrucomicrobiales bacterium]|jgi:4-deoxy-L-threo-5-hexosulose-uronate ketol-isomerase|nr:5-dehydro-4-deoxy-D-glucuronate isomerase [Verrucomicrobiales bacterium]
MKQLKVADEVRYQRMTTAELRGSFMLKLFAEDELELVYTDVDRAVVGSAVPVGGTLTLNTAAALRVAYFLERRELGVINIGGAGRVTVSGEVYELGHCDCLYVGRGNREVTFASDDAASPARFYLLSYPAHKEYPTLLVRKSEVEGIRLGDQAACNKRTLHQCIHPRHVPSCQLVMGFTVLDSGSVWNTMPPHTHERRSEVYLYFDMEPATRVLHLMGKPPETRHLALADGDIVISPPWSIHSGVGTGAYAFCWGMGGENQDFDDMDAVTL